MDRPVPDVSVILITYQSAQHIGRCLAALPAAARRGARDSVSYEVIVVDNASADGGVDALKPLGAVHVLVELERNVGFAAGVNVGLGLARGEYVLLVNPDAVVHPGSIAAAVDFARAHPQRGLYGALTYDSDDDAHPHPGGWRLPSMWSVACFAAGLTAAFPGNRLFDPESLGPWQVGDTRAVGALSGFFLLIRRQLIMQIGGFDEHFFMYSEDIDLAARAQAAGASPVIVPGAAVTHIGGASSTPVDKTVMVLRGRVAYIRKHWPPRRAVIAERLLVAGVSIRALGTHFTARGERWRAVWVQRERWRSGWQGPR